MTFAVVSTILVATMLLHPGHSTRVEVQYNPANQVVEVAMRIDHSDLESALRKRYGRPLVIEKMTDEEASDLIAPYLQQTLRINRQKLNEESFTWVGWERKRISTWVYVELSVADFLGHDSSSSPSPRREIELTILTLLETEPELNHVVAVKDGGTTLTTVTTKQKSKVTIPLTPAESDL